jgi:hypothetical protein
MSSTYLGGSADEQAFGVAVDRLGFTLVTGSTNSSDFPTVRPLQPTLSFAPEADAFLVKLTPNASGLIYATYLDIGADARCPETYPTLNDPCGGVAVDIRGNVYVNAGSPLSRGVFVIKVDAAGRRRVYTFNGFGGEAIALKPTRQLLAPEIFVAGRTRASIFPVLNAYDSSRKSFETEEGFLMKLIDGPNPRASFEETDTRITYTGTWEVDTAPDHSRGAAMRSQEAGATASITFTGTGIQVIGRRDPSAGIFTVMQTTEPFPLVDAYASPAEPRSLLLSISDLPPGTYTVTLKVTGTHNNRATGQWIWIDGFNVIGAP